ncbi:cell wall anchor protein, partial [Avibacterium avium]|uniref:cell wall anchor protein n=1 Tax=Avibacterium avium TaxID=751 RepID=UPI003BF7F54E
MANNNITLKINSAKETLETIHLKSGTVTAIAAQNKVNYQFIDEKTGFAPENIMIKRDGKDLKIAFEGSDIENPDLIIINYYDEDVAAYKDSLLVGMHENGSVYPYVPESTLQPDAVTELADQVSAGQALGGNPIGAFWAFSPLWLLALLPLAIAGVALTKGGNFGGSDDNSNNADTTPPGKPDVEAQNDGSVKVAPPADEDTKKVEITYTDEDGNDHTSTVEKGDDGKWKTTDPNLVVDPDTGVVTIPADKVKDGSEVTGKATDESGNTGEEGKTNAGNNPDTTPPGQPDVDAKGDGSVVITPPSDPDTKKVEITYTDEDGNDHTSTVEKGDDGKWKTTDPNLVVDPDTGVVTIPADKVKDGSEVTGKATDESGNTGEEGKTNAGNNPDTTPPGQPSVDGKVDGSVVVTPPSDPDTKKVEITYTDEDGNDHTSTVEKGDDGKWKTTDPNLVVDPDTGVVTIPADKVKDGSEVTGKATDESGNTGEEGKGIAGNNPGTTTDDNTPTNKDLTPPGKPDVEAQNDGSVKVAPPADEDTKEVEITYPGEDGEDHTVTVE